MQVHPNVPALLSRAIPVAQRVVDGIRPEQLAAPTPCPEWDVRTLLNHLTVFHRMATAAATGDAMPGWSDDLLGDDPPSAFAAAARDAGAALASPGALDRTYPLPWGETPGESVGRMLLADTVIHAWDLAKATGQPTALDPDLCEQVLAWGRSVMRPEYRTPEAGFGPEVPVPPDAPACARLAAFYGRHP
jgi:uncharacterized protein (TIGR03086 family)